MKKSFLLIVCLLCGLTLCAQESPRKAFDSTIARHPVIFGIRGGINFNGFGPDLEKVWDTSLKKRSDSGWNIGLIVDCPILESFYFQPGIYFKTKGFKLAESEEDFTRQVRGKANYLEFPLLFSYRYNVKRGLQFEFNLGPYIGVGMSGTVSDYTYPKSGDAATPPAGLNPDLGVNEDPKIITRDYFGDDLETSFGIKKSDIGITLGIGMTVNRFYIGVQHSMGLKNLSNDVCWGSDIRFRNHSTTLLIGFNINKH